MEIADAEIYFARDLKAFLIRNNIKLVKFSGEDEPVFFWSGTGKKDVNDVVFITLDDIAEIIGYEEIE